MGANDEDCRRPLDLSCDGLEVRDHLAVPLVAEQRQRAAAMRQVQGAYTGRYSGGHDRIFPCPDGGSSNLAVDLGSLGGELGGLFRHALFDGHGDIADTLALRIVADVLSDLH